MINDLKNLFDKTYLGVPLHKMSNRPHNKDD